MEKKTDFCGGKKSENCLNPQFFVLYPPHTEKVKKTKHLSYWDEHVATKMQSVQIRHIHYLVINIFLSFNLISVQAACALEAFPTSDISRR